MIRLRSLSWFALACVAVLPTRQAAAQAFTYQGVLSQSGAPVNGTYDLRFQLWNAASGGAQVGGDVNKPGLMLTNGMLNVSLDFGPSAFDGNPRWLAVQIVTNGGATVTTLLPRQSITPVPYALQTRGLTVDAASNLGINTTAPTARLDVRHGDFVLGPAGEQWYFHSRSSFGGDFLHITDNDAGVTQFQRGLVIHQNGRVGIGTSAPGKKFTVAGSMEVGTSSGDYQHLRIGGGNSSGFLYGSFPHFADGIHLGYNYYADGAGANQILNPGGGTSRLSMLYGTAVIATSPAGGGEPFNRLVVTENGDVGIGTMGPSNRLHVLGTIEGEVGLFTGVRGTTSGTLGSGTSTGVTGIALSNSGGAVGVKGQSNSTGGYDFYAAGAGTDYGSSSSRRWKRNIELIADPLERVEQLRGVYFDWDAEHGGQHDVGFIAEEVGAVLPEIVQYEANGTDAQGMDYSKMTPLLVEAVKALRAEKDAEFARLTAENQTLKETLRALETRLARLETAH